MKEFKLIVAGGRDFNDYMLVSRVLFAMSDNEYADKDISIVCGMARGADKCGYDFAIANGVQLYSFPAKWDIHGKSAGYIRNAEMAQFADGLLAFWNGSKGTGNMISLMKNLNKPVTVIHY